MSTIKWNSIRGQQYDIPVEKISIPNDQASIARGEHIAAIRICKYCHGEALSGESDNVPGLVTFAFPNLTPGAGGVGVINTNEDWVRAIRHGVGNDGRGLILMPSRIWYYLGDDDFWTVDRANSVNIPWYLANALLWQLVNDHLFEYTREEVMMYLRHEAGHAFNYAYCLYDEAEWRRLE